MTAQENWFEWLNNRRNIVRKGNEDKIDRSITLGELHLIVGEMCANCKLWDVRDDGFCYRVQGTTAAEDYCSWFEEKDHES